MGGSWAGAIEIGVGEAGTCLRFFGDTGWIFLEGTAGHCRKSGLSPGGRRQVTDRGRSRIIREKNLKNLLALELPPWVTWARLKS